MSTSGIETGAEAELYVRKDGHAGRITLNRPKALNALTYDMLVNVAATLDAWAQDPAVRVVIVEGAGDKAFCAGGDIQHIYALGQENKFADAADYFLTEYRLDAKVANFPKPYVAIMDGIAMGGGVGVSSNGSHRIVTERTIVSMPECGIGLVPDAGGSRILGHAPGRLGEYCGLTGARLQAGDAILTGFADTFVPKDAIGTLIQALTETGDVAAIADHAADAPAPRLGEHRPLIDAVFDGEDVAGIIAHLRRLDDPFTTPTLNAIERGSPLSLACTLALVRAGRSARTVEEAVTMEYRFTARALEHADFMEGIRAAVIDKDRRPKWAVTDPAAITAERVAEMLAPAPGGDWTANS